MDEGHISRKDVKLLEHLLDQARKSAFQAEVAVNDALAYVAESEKRLAKLARSSEQRKNAIFRIDLGLARHIDPD